MSRRVSKVFKSKPKDFPDLSEGFDRRFLNNGEVLARYGVAGNVIAAAYDQVQSLLAIATFRTIYVFGQDGVEVSYHISAGRDIRFLIIHGAHLVAIDSKNTIYAYSLDGTDREPVATHPFRGLITAVHVDPILDWLFLGLKDGSVETWDLEAEQLNTTFKIKNQYFERQEEWRLMEESYAVPRYHISPAVQLCLHPLDLGMLLITYADGAALYSLKEGKTKRFYECILPEDGTLPERKPALTCGTFSPNGEFVLIGLTDGTFCFFNYKESDQPLQVRTLTDTDVNLPRKHHLKDDLPATGDPIIGIDWCCRQDPDDTFLLIVGGSSMGLKGVSILDFGKPPTTSQDISEYFATPQRQRILPIYPRDQVLFMLPLGTSSPYYMVQNPSNLLLLMGSGNPTILDLPDGERTSPLRIPPSLGFCLPSWITFTVTDCARHIRSRLIHNMNRRHNFQSPLLIGGAPNQRGDAVSDNHQILCTIHRGSLVRLYDSSQGQLMHGPLLEFDASATLPKSIVEHVAVSGLAGELALASESGIVVLYRLNAKTNDEQLADFVMDLSLVSPMPTPVKLAENMLFKFDSNNSTEAEVFPICVIQARRGQITSLKVSNVGFVAIGYESGLLMVVDLRGPAIFYANECSSIGAKKDKSIFKRADAVSPRPGDIEHPTACAFQATNLDGRLSLVVLVGTSLGRCICLELLKEASGVYEAVLSNVYSSSSTTAIRHIVGVGSIGESLDPTGSHLAELHTDANEPNCIFLVSDDEVTSVDSEMTKKYRTTFRGRGARSAQTIAIPGTPEVNILAIAQVSGGIEFFSIPELRVLGTSGLSGAANDTSSFITSSGEVFYNTEENELVQTNILGMSASRKRAPVALFDALKRPAIPRPTISNLAWITGTQYVRPSDLDLIISGGNRPLSQRAQERIAASAKQQELLGRRAIAQGKTADRSSLQSAKNTGGGAYGDMGTGGLERGERVNHINDLYDNISKASSEWLSEVDKMTSQAKKSAGKAAFKSLLGL